MSVRATTNETTGADEAPTTGGLSRRNLLGLAALGVGGGAVLASQATTAASAATTVTTASAVQAGAFGAAAPAAVAPAPTEISGLTPFPQQPDLNFQAQFNYGEAAYGAAEVGEVAAGVFDVNAAMAALDGQPVPVYEPYNATFEALAARLAGEADADRAAGRYVSARSKYLRAAGYYTGVLFFVLGTGAPTREPEIYAAMQRCWAEAAALLEPVWTRVEIPMTVRFPDSTGAPVARAVTVPAYWARAAGDGPKPTVIVNNGSDAQLVDTYAFGGAAALERGYNALMFEGPGQGSLLFEQDIPFTPYWEDVITPLVDFVLAQPETDPEAIALTGWSFGGLLVMRAAAYEHRIKAVVADPVFYDPTTPYEALKQVPSNEDWDYFYSSLPAYGLERPIMSQAYYRFLLNKRGEIFGEAFHAQALTGVVMQDIIGLLAAIGSYTGDAALFGKITAHSLLLSYEYDTFFTGQDATVKGWMTGAASVGTHFFSEAEGAQFHCAPMAPQVRNEVVYAWLDQVLAHAPTPPAPPVPPVPPLPPVPAPVPAPAAGSGGADGALAATGLDAGPIAAIAGGLATAGAGAAALAAKVKASGRRS